jgi:hypothetical protein
MVSSINIDFYRWRIQREEKFSNEFSCSSAIIIIMRVQGRERRKLFKSCLNALEMCREESIEEEERQ